VTVVPVPAGLDDFDFEKKLKSAPGAAIVERWRESNGQGPILI
jgi:hypothetical protein